jgi:hypothetical protein
MNETDVELDDIQRVEDAEILAWIPSLYSLCGGGFHRPPTD